MRFAYRSAVPMTPDSRQFAAPSRRHVGAAPRTRMLAFALVLALPALQVHAAQSPTAPTATTLSPEVIDQQWLDATAAYAPERERLVREAEAGARRPVPPRLGGTEGISIAGVVRQRQVRHLHPLGRVLGAGIRQRVVFAQHVSGRFQGIRPSRGHLRPAGELRLQGSDSQVHRAQVRPEWLGQAVPRVRRALCGAGGRAP